MFNRPAFNFSGQILSESYDFYTEKYQYQLLHQSIEKGR